MVRLKRYAKYLHEKYLDQLTADYLQMIKSMDIPLLKLYSNLSDKDLFRMSRQSMSRFLESLVNDTCIRELERSLEAWESDKLPGISKEDILPTDIIQVYYVQKTTILKFIPEYTQDSREFLGIVENLEDYYKTAQHMTFGLLFKIREETTRQQALNENLKRQVRDRTRELKTKNNDLEAFTYSVAHDLKAPLRSINGFTQVLLEDYGDQLDTDAIKTLKIIVKNAGKMGMLIEDLLSYSSLGKQKIQIENIDMDKLVKREIEDLMREYNPKATIKMDRLPPVDGDYILITQVINNLISNALKYSAKNENPVIEIGVKRSNPAIVFFIRDNGIGFHMKYYKKIFGVFQRLHKSSEFEGTGVGLAIVKKIIDMHHGKIWAESALNEGSTFYFSLNKN